MRTCPFLCFIIQFHSMSSALNAAQIMSQIRQSSRLKEKDKIVNVESDESASEAWEEDAEVDEVDDDMNMQDGSEAGVPVHEPIRMEIVDDDDGEEGDSEGDSEEEGEDINIALIPENSMESTGVYQVFGERKPVPLEVRGLQIEHVLCFLACMKDNDLTRKVCANTICTLAPKLRDHTSGKNHVVYVHYHLRCKYEVGLIGERGEEKVPGLKAVNAQRQFLSVVQHTGRLYLCSAAHLRPTQTTIEAWNTTVEI